jgi:hypothetical protein
LDRSIWAHQVLEQRPVAWAFDRKVDPLEKRMARTTHRSKSGSKLYAKRSKKGRFTDIQSYKQAHGSDLQRSSSAERAKKKGTKKASRKKAAKKK